jgi:ParB family transcriptional regulator, chromosome partitioning protein
MKTVEISIDQINAAPWNANVMDDRTIQRLRESISRYGLLQPLVVRPTSKSQFEILSGNQRLKVLRENNYKRIPCVIVDLDDAKAMLLAQALNGIHGEDDLAMKGSMLNKILSSIPKEKVLSLLPETAESLAALSSIGKEDLAAHLKAWQLAQSARLKHMQLQFSNEQLQTVEQALDMVIAKAKNTFGKNPNIRGVAMYMLARYYLERNKRR